MSVLKLHNKSKIHDYLSRNTYLHIYGIGDLDDFYWRFTTWYGLQKNGDLKAVILLYTGLDIPVLIVLSDDIEPLSELLIEIIPYLPERFYAHLSPGMEKMIESEFHLKPHGCYYKMALQHPSRPGKINCPDVIRLNMDYLDRLLQLYDQSYPGHWFDERMLSSGQYFGMIEDNRLASVAGVHVYSSHYKVAALGNIATHPDYRGRGFGKKVTARLCQSLLETVEIIGLNVKADNDPAIVLYKNLGFAVSNTYYEYMVEKAKT